MSPKSGNLAQRHSKVKDGAKDQITYEIKHFGEAGQSEEKPNETTSLSKHPYGPTLGRFRLFESLPDVQTMIAEWHKAFANVFSLYFPLLFAPLPSVAASQQLLKSQPSGFEAFDAQLTASQPSLIDRAIELNQMGVSSVEFLLDKIIGDPAGCAGLSIVLWAALLKVLTTPVYENAVRYPLLLRKTVQDLTEIKLETSESIEAFVNAEDSQIAEILKKQRKEGKVDPDKAFLYPLINGFLVDLPIFFIQVNTMFKLPFVNKNFSQPFLFLPSLAGPTYGAANGFAWLAHMTPNDLGYFILPLLVVTQVLTQARLERANQIMENTSLEYTFQLAAPFFFFFASLYTPSAVALNWLATGTFSTMQLLYTRNKLKAQEGLDLIAINQRDEEIREKIQRLVAPEKMMRIAYDSISGNIRLVPIVPPGMQQSYDKMNENKKQDNEDE